MSLKTKNKCGFKGLWSGFIRKQDGQWIIVELVQTQRESYFSVFPESSFRPGHSFIVQCPARTPHHDVPPSTDLLPEEEAQRLKSRVWEYFIPLHFSCFLPDLKTITAWNRLPVLLIACLSSPQPWWEFCNWYIFHGNRRRSPGSVSGWCKEEGCKVITPLAPGVSVLTKIVNQDSWVLEIAW